MTDVKWFNGETDDISDAYRIRRTVFMEEQNVSEADEFDRDGDRKSQHVVIYENGSPVATGRLLIGEDCVIGRVAVLKAHRGKHFGKLVMKEAIHKANEMGFEKQIIHAQLHAKGFYEGIGFISYGDVYAEAGIEHISMYHMGNA